MQEITKKIIKFRDDRDWKQFHKPKDLAISLVLEATELLELFQWKNEKEQTEVVKEKKEELGDEIADVFYCLSLIANDLGIDILKAVEMKLKKSALKYPIEKAKGSAKKYTEYN